MYLRAAAQIHSERNAKLFCCYQLLHVEFEKKKKKKKARERENEYIQTCVRTPSADVDVDWVQAIHSQHNLQKNFAPESKAFKSYNKHSNTQAYGATCVSIDCVLCTQIDFSFDARASFRYHTAKV